MIQEGGNKGEKRNKTKEEKTNKLRMRGRRDGAEQEDGEENGKTRGRSSGGRPYPRCWIITPYEHGLSPEKTSLSSIMCYNKSHYIKI
jgi:hypothetical protein